MEKRKLDFVATAYIFDSEKRVLLIYHNKRDMWLPVGGHIEANETPDEALRREIKEEVSLSVEILGQTKTSKEGDVKENLAKFLEFTAK